MNELYIFLNFINYKCKCSHKSFIFMRALVREHLKSEIFTPTDTIRVMNYTLKHFGFTGHFLLVKCQA